MAQKRTLVPGHRFAGVKLAVSTKCKCGWTSSTWFGKGARASAYSEFRSHLATHARLQGDTTTAAALQRKAGEA